MTTDEKSEIFILIAVFVNVLIVSERIHSILTVRRKSLCQHFPFENTHLNIYLSAAKINNLIQQHIKTY